MFHHGFNANRDRYKKQLEKQDIKNYNIGHVKALEILMDLPLERNSMTLQAQVVEIKSGKTFRDGQRRYILRVHEADEPFNDFRVPETVFTKRPLPVLDDIITLSFDTSF